MNDDDNKQLNTTEDQVEEIQVDSSMNDASVDVAPIGEDAEEMSPQEAEEIREELSEEPAEEQADSDVEEITPEDEEAEEAAQEEVDEENAQTSEDLGVTEDTSTVVANDNPNARWYVVHTYSGHENRVATNLRQRIETESLEHKIVDILVPTQDKIEIRSGKKEQVKEKVFPGYILVKMELDNSTWLAVRTTQGVISFVGAGSKPLPISDAEVKSIVQFMNQGAAPTFKEVFLVDDTVKIIDGPFADFIGKVESVDKEKGKLRVLVSIFGRETPVELDFLQVSKL